MNAKPYPKYEPSGVEWLGDVPEHWIPIQMKWLARRYAGGTPDRNNSAYWEDGDIPWINSGAVNQQLVTEPSEYITREGYSNSSAKFVPKGGLVMALAGQGKTKGMIAQVAFDTTCNQSMAAIVPNINCVTRYLYWLLESQYQQIRNMAGGEQRDGLNLEILGSIPVFRFPISEQQAIADFLDDRTAKLDALLEKKRALIGKLKEKRSALTSRTVTKGLPPAAAIQAGLNPNPKLKPSGIEWLGDIPKAWICTKVWIHRVSGNLDLQDGNHGEIHPKAEDYRDEGIPFIMANHIDQGRIDFDRCNFIEQDQAESLRIGFAKTGDVLLTHKGTIGRVGIVQDSEYPYVMLTPQVTYYRCKRALLNRFLRWQFESRFWFDQLELVGGLGSTRAYIGLLAQKTLWLLLPPSDLQAAISDYLDIESAKIDRMIAKVESAIEKLAEYRAALISASVTGKIDVRNQI